MRRSSCSVWCEVSACSEGSCGLPRATSAMVSVVWMYGGAPWMVRMSTFLPRYCLLTVLQKLLVGI